MTWLKNYIETILCDIISLLPKNNNSKKMFALETEIIFALETLILFAFKTEIKKSKNICSRNRKSI
jgi:hypothetical protein